MTEVIEFQKTQAKRGNAFFKVGNNVYRNFSLEIASRCLYNIPGYGGFLDLAR